MRKKSDFFCNKICKIKKSPYLCNPFEKRTKFIDIIERRNIEVKKEDSL